MEKAGTAAANLTAGHKHMNQSSRFGSFSVFEH